MRRGGVLLATIIPRSVWDPQHANMNWTDSYAAPIADRRHWPAKKWSIGLEPRTPSDWLSFSYRNLAYAYNGALRSCSTFPEMLVYYKEMKVRKVKVDVDTMNLMLSRAARYERIEVDDIFLLFDEMLSLGARPDFASAEILHTVWEHSLSKPVEWREARRRQLIELYSELASEEIAKLSKHHVNALLAAQIQRYRAALNQLQSRLRPSLYQKYLPHIDYATTLLREVHNFLWEFVPPDQPAVDLRALQMRIPFIATVLRRPDVTATPTTYQITDFEDYSVCAIFQSALERCVDRDFHDSTPFSERRLFLSLLTMLTSSGVLYTRDLMAQFMDVIKYSRDEINHMPRNGSDQLNVTVSNNRDNDAVRVLRYCLRGSSAVNDDVFRTYWLHNMLSMDGRVIGRYIAARSPWSNIRFCFDEHYQFSTYPVLELTSSSRMLLSSSKSYLDSTSETNNNNNNNNSDNNDKDDSSDSNNSNSDDNSADPVIEEHGGEDVETNVQVLSQMQGVREQLRTAEALQLRWNDIQTLIRRTKVLDDFITYPNMNYYNSVTHNENYNNSSQSPTKHNNNNNNNNNNKNSNEYVVVVSKIQELKHKMEVFTGQAVFLRNVATGSRYGSLEAAFSTQAVGELSDSNEESSYEGEITKSSNLHTFNTSSLAKNEASALITERATLSLFAQGLSLEVWKLLFTLTHQLYEAQEKFIQSHSGAEPELECWESMLIVLRCILDYTVLNRRKFGGRVGSSNYSPTMSHASDKVINNNNEGVDSIDTLFTHAAQMRTKMIEESRTRFDGRMKIL